MSNTQVIGYIKVIIEILLIVVLGLIVIKIVNSTLLRINTLKVVKEDLFKAKDENNEYYNYLNIFESYILNGDYEKAYALLDENNAKEKFNDIQDFKEKIKLIYSNEKTCEYNVEEILNKEKYNDVYVKAYVSYEDNNGFQSDIIELMIREYSNFDYKIYIRTNLSK